VSFTGDTTYQIRCVRKYNFISANDTIEINPRGAYGYFNIRRLPLKPQLLNFVDIIYTFQKTKIHDYEAWIF